MAHWNWLDWVLAIIVFISVVTAIRKGFVAELVTLASAITALIIAALYYERAAPLLAGFTRSRGVALGAAFILLFAAVLLIGALIAVIARKLIKKVELQWFDRFLGGVFGLVRGLLVDCVLLLVMMAFAIKQGAVQKSALAPYVTTGSRVIALAMPKDMKNDFRAGLEKFKKDLTETDKKAIEARPTGKAKL
jgi:membrane protein required for colicin V production